MSSLETAAVVIWLWTTTPVDYHKPQDSPLEQNQTAPAPKTFDKILPAKKQLNDTSSQIK